MTASVKISDVLTQVKQLNKDDQFTLLQQLASLLKRKEDNKQQAVSLNTLSGLGSEIWKSETEINQYIDSERQW